MRSNAAKTSKDQDLGALLAGDRAQLLDRFYEKREERNQRYRDAILKRRRVDLLAKILGYDIVPGIHDAILKHQIRHSWSLILGFRNCGKSVVGTITKCIYEILRDREIRIVIASKKAQLAESILRDIKSHFESNELFREIFGDYVGEEIWSASEILVRGARKQMTPTIAAVGVEGTLVGKHPDILILDDPIDENNSRTDGQREKVETWFRKIAFPTLNPPVPGRPGVGQFHVLATRYHPKDLVGGFEAETVGAARTLKILPTNEAGEPRWPSRWGAAQLEAARKAMGFIAYKSQYEMDTRPMEGKFFSVDQCDMVEWSQVPKDGGIFMGVDLASGLDAKHDRTAIVVLKVCPIGHLWVIDVLAGRWTALETTRRIVETYKKHHPLRIGIESVGYQAVQPQLVAARSKEAGLVVVPVPTTMGKEYRAMRLQPIVEAGQLHFAPGTHDARDELVLFPDGDHDDYFDGIDLARTVARTRAHAARDRSKQRRNLIHGRRRSA